MAGGQGSARRSNAKRAAKKKEAKKAAKRQAATQPASSIVPAVTEFSHFGDDTKPATWFVDAETALNYDPALDEEEEDELGYYEDGVKRTLTDEQIEMFRHSEIAQLVREGKLHEEDTFEETHSEGESDYDVGRSRTPRSDASSIEGDLVGLVDPALPQGPRPRAGKDKTTRQRRSESPRVAGLVGRRREEEVPYDERHKRKWEDYIEDNDPIEGSITHRRMARELDEQRDESVDLDY